MRSGRPSSLGETSDSTQRPRRGIGVGMRVHGIGCNTGSPVGWGRVTPQLSSREEEIVPTSRSGFRRLRDENALPAQTPVALESETSTSSAARELARLAL